MNIVSVSMYVVILRFSVFGLMLNELVICGSVVVIMVVLRYFMKNVVVMRYGKKLVV